jgi:hypothetical protein
MVKKGGNYVNVINNKNTSLINNPTSNMSQIGSGNSNKDKDSHKNDFKDLYDQKLA